MADPTIHFKAKSIKDGQNFNFSVLKCTVASPLVRPDFVNILLQNLPDMDAHSWNATDAYIMVKVGDQKEQKTPKFMNSLNPVFTKDSTFTFNGGAGAEVELVIMDWDPVSRDDLVAKVNNGSRPASFVSCQLHNAHMLLMFRPQ